jgi:hypothetical protein
MAGMNLPCRRMIEDKRIRNISPGDAARLCACGREIHPAFQAITRPIGAVGNPQLSTPLGIDRHLMNWPQRGQVRRRFFYGVTEALPMEPAAVARSPGRFNWVMTWGRRTEAEQQAAVTVRNLSSACCSPVDIDRSI